jgi:hypothetical protein
MNSLELKHFAHELVDFLCEVADKVQVRDDYQELLEVTMTVLDIHQQRATGDHRGQFIMHSGMTKLKSLKSTSFCIATITNRPASLYKVGNLQAELTYMVFMAPLAAPRITRQPHKCTVRH